MTSQEVLFTRVFANSRVRNFFVWTLVPELLWRAYFALDLVLELVKVVTKLLISEPQNLDDYIPHSWSTPSAPI